MQDCYRNHNRPLSDKSPWPAERPVRDGYALPLAESLAPGAYTLSVGLTRASDAAVIAAQQGWRTVEQVPVGTITITP